MFRRRHHEKGILAASVPAFIAALALCSPGLAQVDAPRVVLDQGVGEQVNPDITFDAQGRILVAYHHAGEGTLKLARITCHSIQIDLLHLGGQAGLTPSLVLDTQGQANVAHRSCGDGWGCGLRYTMTGWPSAPTATVAIPGAEDGSKPVLALDSVDRPYVAYESGSQEACLARFDIPSGEWVSEVIPGPRLMTNGQRLINVAIDSQDRPVVAYTTDMNEIAVATRSSNGGWTLRAHTLDSGIDYGGLALAIDAADAPHVALALSGDVVVFRFNMLGVSEETLYTAGARIGPHSMAIDNAGRVWLVTANPPAGELKLYTRLLGVGWSSQDLVEPWVSSISAPASLAVGPDDQWAVAYRDVETQDELLVMSPALGTTVSPDFDLDLDVDREDLDFLQGCATGPSVRVNPRSSCREADLDGDDDVDQTDFAMLQRYFSGEGVDADPDCSMPPF